MDDNYVSKRRSDHKLGTITNLHQYHAQLFNNVMDWQKEELGHCFSEVKTKLLVFMSRISLSDSFYLFDKSELVRLADFYPRVFSASNRMLLGDELGIYIHIVCSRVDFLSLDGIIILVKKIVDRTKNGVYPHVYLLKILPFVLPVSTATVDRAFSSMHIIKNRLCNRLGDEWLNDCLIPYIEKDVLDCIDDKEVMKHYQSMENNRGQL